MYMYCTKCGIKQVFDAKFCTDCGNQLENGCVSCLKCINCNNELSEKDKFCINCGYEVKVKNKMGVVSKIAMFIIIILFIIPSLPLIFGDGSDGAGWMFIGLSLMCSFLIPYYLILFVVSLIFDLIGKNNKIKNGIIIAFLLLPLVFFLMAGAEGSRKSWTLRGVTATFPKDMIGSYNDFFEEASFYYRYSNNELCTIEFGVDDYKNELDLIDNFQYKIDNIQYRIDNFQYKSNGNIAYDNYNNVSYLDKISINGRIWYYYEKEFTYQNYKMYGMTINNNFYFIEIINDKAIKEDCNNRVDKFLNTIKYKL